MSKTPLRPVIEMAEMPSSLCVCGCCGFEDDKHTVKHIRFRWEDVNGKVYVGGGTSVALCPDCRRRAAIVLVESL